MGRVMGVVGDNEGYEGYCMNLTRVWSEGVA